MGSDASENFQGCTANCSFYDLPGQARFFFRVHVSQLGHKRNDCFKARNDFASSATVAATAARKSCRTAPPQRWQFGAPDPRCNSPYSRRCPTPTSCRFSVVWQPAPTRGPRLQSAPALPLTPLDSESKAAAYLGCLCADVGQGVVHGRRIRSRPAGPHKR